jgi:hypothetical protein
MVNFTLYEREVIDIKVEGVCSWDYPDFADSYLSSAYWKDTLKPLDEAEMEDLSLKYPDLAYDLAWESFH